MTIVHIFFHFYFYVGKKKSIFKIKQHENQKVYGIVRHGISNCRL